MYECSEVLSSDLGHHLVPTSLSLSFYSPIQKPSKVVNVMNEFSLETRFFKINHLENLGNFIHITPP